MFLKQIDKPSIEELNQLREIQALRYLNRNIHILQLAEVI